MEEGFWKEGTPQLIMRVIEDNIKLLGNNLMLTFSEGQKIIELILRIMLVLP